MRGRTRWEGMASPTGMDRGRSRQFTSVQVVVRMRFGLAGFEVFRLVVPVVVVDVMDPQVSPEVVDLAVRVSDQPVKVEVAVVADLRIPRSDTRVVVDIELYPGREDHADHPELPDILA